MQLENQVLAFLVMFYYLMSYFTSGRRKSIGGSQDVSSRESAPLCFRVSVSDPLFQITWQRPPPGLATPPPRVTVCSGEPKTKGGGVRICADDRSLEKFVNDDLFWKHTRAHGNRTVCLRVAFSIDSGKRQKGSQL